MIHDDNRLRSAATPLSAPGERYCLVEGMEALDQAAQSGLPRPWAPGRREEVADVERVGTRELPAWCIAEVDIFRDLSAAEMDAIGAAAPMKTYGAGELIYSPHKPIEALFILKTGRVRVFRVSPDGRALTTALITPGTIFGEMVPLGQRMYDNFAEAMEESIVCVMSRADVHRFLLSDPRIAARIAEILGNRLAEMERRLSDSYFKSVPERIAGTLVTLASQHRRTALPSRAPTVSLTHEQIAALAGTSRETATKVLGDLAERGLIRLGRGRVTVLDLDQVSAEAGDF
jgi:CRP/FNR family transcriptional regulator, cyclic AMP receptor protein